MKKKTKIIITIFIVLIGISVIFLPIEGISVQEVYSMFMFKFFTAKAKVDHLIKVKNMEQGKEVIILGTAHYIHMENNKYPVWEIKSIIKSIKPDVIFVEIRPESIKSDLWGEGPIEMPFSAFVAKEMRIEVKGIDDFSSNFEKREDLMVKNIIENLSGYKNAFIVTGYSHLSGFVKRLEKENFFLENWEQEEKEKIFNLKVERKLPNGLIEAIQKSIEQAEEGKSMYTKEWAKKRREFIELLKGDV